MVKQSAIAVAIMAGSLAAAPVMAAEPVLYTGLNVGWNATEFEITNSGSTGGNTYTTEETGSGSGATYGGVLGVKFPISTGYLGLEANVSDSGAEYEREEFLNGSNTRAEKITSDLSMGVSGILAFNVNAHSQIYGIAGYQLTSFEAKSATRDLGTGEVTTDSADETLGGIRVGVGIETAITSSISARLEWTSNIYSEEDFEISTADGPRDTELKPTAQRIALGFVGHF